jgi:hypothetical protein
MSGIPMLWLGRRKSVLSLVLGIICSLQTRKSSGKISRRCCIATRRRKRRWQLAGDGGQLAGEGGGQLAGDAAALSGFGDAEAVEAVPEYARGALAWAISAGIMRGGDANSLNPNGFATRAETAAMLHRFLSEQA